MSEQKFDPFITKLCEAWHQDGLYTVFYECWKKVGADPRQARKVFLNVRDRYHEPHRRHHGWFHIEAGIGFILEFAECIGQIEWVILAYFFHDVIFDPKKNDNELQSEKFCTAVLERAQANILAVAGIRQFIMLTDHHQKPWIDTPAKQCIVSVDLVTIGASPENFRRYWENLRFEFSHLSEEDYTRKQKAFLWSLYQQDAIYTFPPLWQRYEQAARNNILALHMTQQKQTAVN